MPSVFAAAFELRGMVVTMSINGPIVIGGNGHSGTRVFCDIVALGGVFTGIRHITKRANSSDLRIIDLLNKWVEPYVYNRLSDAQAEQMRRAFSRRFYLYFPFRSAPWGFKNPRTMLILPLLDQIFRGMKFLHVTRDGRDIAFGNPFVNQNRYADAYLTDDERHLGPEERMILFWGRSNADAWNYGIKSMGERYLHVRWEDLCQEPAKLTGRILAFAGCTRGSASEVSRIVQRPNSMGRWKAFPQDVRERVISLGRPWLSQFGYD